MAIGVMNLLFRADTENFERKLKQSKQSVDGFSAGLKKVGGIVGAAFSTVAVVDFGKACVTAFDESEKAAAKLNVAMKGNQEATDRLIRQASALQNKSLIDDETIQKAQMYLATIGMTEAQISRIIPLVMDFATKTGSDLGDAAMTITKGFVGSGKALKQLGMDIHGTAGSAERFDSIIAGLTDQVGGLSEAATQAGTSGLVQLKNSFDDIKESIGGIIANSGLFAEFVKLLKDVAQLKSGKFFENVFTDAETGGRNIVASTKNIEDAKVALDGYIDKLKEKYNAELKAGAEAQALWKKEKVWSSTYAFPDKVAMQKAQQSIQAIAEAIKKNRDLRNDEFELFRLITDGNKKVSISEAERLKLEEAAGKAERERNKQTLLTGELRQKQYTEQIKALEKINELYKEQPRYIFNDTINTPFRSYRNEMAVPSQVNNPGAYAPPASLEDRKLSKYGGKGYTDAEAIDGASKSFALLNEGMTLSVDLVSQISEGLKEVGDVLKYGADSWEEFGQMAVKAIKQVIAGIIATSIAEAIKNAISSSKIFGPASAIVGPGLGALAGGLAAGAFSTLVPKFADGGLAYSPMLAMVGDNRNSSIDPEVIAPLSKLQAMMSVNVTGHSVIKGKDIYTIWTKENDFINRTSGLR